MAAKEKNNFHAQIRLALPYLNEPLELAEQSALANHYFLGNHLSKIRWEAVTQKEPYGYALQKLMLEGLETLAKREGEKYRELIMVKYVEGLSRDKACEKLGIRKSAFHSRDKDAIKFLSEILLEQSHPTLRLETLPQIRRDRKQKTLIGRDDELAACQQILADHGTLALVGPGGVGKSTLGSYLATEWGEKLAFWYTIRPGLNDQLGSLLFALGYFFHQHEIPHLWAELASHEGEIKLDRLQWAIYDVIEKFKEKYRCPPLFCFDEMDLLKVSEIREHGQIQTLIEELRDLAPQIVIGQQIWLHTADQHKLAGFTLADTRMMLTDAALSLKMAELQQIHKDTQGNPQLLELIITLHQLEEPITETLEALSRNFTVLSLLDRVVQRLHENERALLQEMIVYRGPVPSAQWSSKAKTAVALNSLIERHLVRAEARGSVAIISTYRQALYQQATIEVREELHQRAARVRASTGEYTAAAYHHIQGGQISQAIWLWHEHQESEIHHGQASTALELFRAISSTNLEHHDQERLKLIRSKLELLMGDTARARETLQSILFHTPVWELESLEQQGLIDSTNGDYDNAKNHYEQALALAESLVDSRLTYLHKNLGWVASQERNMEKAWYEAQLAQYEAENFQGSVQGDRGNIEDAQRHYDSALQIAEKWNHTEYIAKTCNHLYAIYLLRGEFEKAEEFLNKAESCCQKIGKTRSIAGAKYNQALLYNQSGQYEKSAASALEALDLFKRLGDSKGKSYANQVLAEASVNLGRLEDAEHYAYAVQDEEEIQMFPDFHWILGQIRVQQGDIERAEAYFNEAVRLAQSNNDPYIEAYSWRSWGEMHLGLSQVEKAQAAFQKSIDLFEGMKLPYEVEKTRALM